MYFLEAFKGAVWNYRTIQNEHGATGYKYAVIGVLVTNKPIPGLEASETFIAGRCPGMATALEFADHGVALHRLGDARDILTSLHAIVPPQSEGLDRRPGESWRQVLARSMAEEGLDSEAVERWLEEYDRMVDKGSDSSAQCAVWVLGRCTWDERPAKEAP